MEKLIRILILIITLFTATDVTAQFTAEKAFAGAPNRIFPMVDSITKLDMIDYYNSGGIVASKNAFDGESRITKINPEQVNVKMSDASEYQIIILPSKKDSIIAVISTLATPIEDSNIKFYDCEWNDLQDVKFEEPKLKDWLTDEGKKSIADVENTIPFILVSYFYDPSFKTLMLSHNMAEYVSEENRGAVEKWLKPNLKYQWTGKKMKLLKK